MSNQVVTFHYTLKNKEGKVIENSYERKEPMAFLEGTGSIIPDLEDVIVSLKPGEKKEVTIAHERAYGVYNQNLIYKVTKDKFPTKDAKVGDVFQMDNQDRVQLVTVVEINDNEVILDANHPLVGVDLTFLIEIISKRPATKEEMSHGHVHGAGGHHH